MYTGFDLYPLGSTTPMETFQIPVSKRMIKSTAFTENGKGVVCGSDHGKIYIYASKNAQPAHILKVAGKTDPIQAVAVGVFYWTLIASDIVERRHHPTMFSL